MSNQDCDLVDIDVAELVGGDSGGSSCSGHTHQPRSFWAVALIHFSEMTRKWDDREAVSHPYCGHTTPLGVIHAHMTAPGW